MRRNIIVVLVLCGAVGAVAVWLAPRLRPATTSGARARLRIALPPDTLRLSDLGGGIQNLVLSPDASRVAFVGRRADGRLQIFVRRMDRPALEPVPGTEAGGMPFFSPDGEWLGFWSEGKLKRVPLSGGDPLVICDAADPRGASWGADGTIVMLPDNVGPLYRVPASGGTPELLTRVDDSRQEDSHRWPQILPGGRAVLFSGAPTSGREMQRTIEAVTLADGRRTILARGGSRPQYAGGYLFFGRGGDLLAAPFDAERLVLLGDPRPVLQDVLMDPKQTGRVDYDVGPAGTLVYVPGFPKPRARSLDYVDRQGRRSPVTSAKRAFYSPAISPDGHRLAVVVQGEEDTLWVLDLRSDTLERMTFEGDVNAVRWSADGDRLLFISNAEGPRSLFTVAADGKRKPQKLFGRPDLWINSLAVHPGGAGTLMVAQTSRGHDLLFLPEGRREPQPFVATPADEQGAAFSPDGRLVAYVSEESGQYQVYVRPFPGPGRTKQVSAFGGGDPRWRRDGKELFFLEGVRLVSVGVEAGPAPQFGKPRALFEISRVVADLNWDVTPDSERFVMVKPESTADAPLEIVVIPGFIGEMKARLATTAP